MLEQKTQKKYGWKGTSCRNAPSHSAIFFIKVSLKILLDYIQTLRTAKNQEFTVSNYLKSLHYPNSEDLVIADLSDINIGDEDFSELLDLRGANFCDSFLYNTSFVGCDLERATFSGVDLEDVTFRKSNLNFVDFRDCILTNCNFDKSYCHSPWNNIQGLKIASTASCARVYADVKNDKAKKNEQQRLIDNKKIELKEVWSKISFLDKLSHFFDFNENVAAYKKVQNELQLMEKGGFARENIINRSFNNIFNAESIYFDPVVLSQEEENDGLTKQYVPLSRLDLNDYLNKLKSSGTKPLNEFAKHRYYEEAQALRRNCERPLGSAAISGSLHVASPEIAMAPSKPRNDVVGLAVPRNDAAAAPACNEVVVIADLSSKVNLYGNNEWNRLNYSGIDFSGCDLSNTNFSGCDLSRSMFNNAKLINTNFECAKMVDVVFNDVIAENCNFTNADLSKVVIENSNFKHANFNWAFCKGAKIIQSDLRYITAIHSVFRRSNIMSTNMAYTNLRKIDFSNSNIADSDLSFSLLDSTIMNGVKGSGVNLSKAHLHDASLIDSIWYNSDFSDAKAAKSNLTGVKISDDSFMERIDLSGSVLDGIKAPNGRFRGANFDNIKMAYGKLACADLERTQFRFADLNSCLLSEANCLESDFTGATLYNLLLNKAVLKNSVFYGAKISNSDFTRTDCENSDWQNVEIKDSILSETNNHRIRINDNSVIEESVLQALDGQFYHYDEDSFMNIMFIEQQQALQDRIKYSEKILQYGLFSPLLKLISKKYRISVREAQKVMSVKEKNQAEFEKYILTLNAPVQNQSYRRRFLLCFENALRYNSPYESFSDGGNEDADNMVYVTSKE